jgi:hypothetical protein
MMRSAAVLLMLLCVAQPHPCKANPDGPVGSISITPHYTFCGSDNLWDLTQTEYPYPYKQGVGKRETRIGADLLVPAASFLTLSLGFESVSGPGKTAYPGYPGPNSDSVSRLESSNVAFWTFAARIWIPFNSRASEKLRQ